MFDPLYWLSFFSATVALTVSTPSVRQRGLAACGSRGFDCDGGRNHRYLFRAGCGTGDRVFSREPARIALAQPCAGHGFGGIGSAAGDV